MIPTIVKRTAWYYPRAVFTTLGLFWLVIEPIIGLTGNSLNLTYWELFRAAAIFGLVWFFIDGYFVSGYLRQRVEITSSGFDSRIVIKFGDLFKEDGWRAIAVNDFFDSVVDDNLVSSRSLHGILLHRYWGGNIADWDLQVTGELRNSTCATEQRDFGKKERYPIGTTVAVKRDGSKFLCVALTCTNTQTQEAKASSPELHKAICGLLQKARSVCAGEPLSIPLMGSGLARVGLKNNILVDLILTAIFEETKKNKITDEIRIILPRAKASSINLSNLKRDWS